MTERRRPLTVVSETLSVGHLLNDPAQAWDLNESEARALLPRVAALQAVLAVRLAIPSQDGAEPVATDPGEDRLLTAAEVAAQLGLSVEAVYRRRFPFARKLGRRSTRFSSAGLAEWLAGRSRPS